MLLAKIFSALNQYDRTRTCLLVNAFPREGVSWILLRFISGRGELAVGSDIFRTEQTINGLSKGVCRAPLLVPTGLPNVVSDSVKVLLATNPRGIDGVAVDIGAGRNLTGCSAFLEVDVLNARDSVIAGLRCVSGSLSHLGGNTFPARGILDGLDTPIFHRTRSGELVQGIGNGRLASRRSNFYVTVLENKSCIVN